MLRYLFLVAVLTLLLIDGVIIVLAFWNVVCIALVVILGFIDCLVGCGAFFIINGMAILKNSMKS